MWLDMSAIPRAKQHQHVSQTDWSANDTSVGTRNIGSASAGTGLKGSCLGYPLKESLKLAIQSAGQAAIRCIARCRKSITHISNTPEAI